jgi:ribosomal protein S18 acetylase RimI-like enzyme
MARSEPTVRSIGADDWRALRELRLEALRTCPADLTADLAQAEARPEAEWREWAMRDGRDGRNVIFLAFAEDAEPAGMAGVRGEANPKLGHSANLWGVYVRPAHRRMGLARRLVDACVGFARERGFVTIKLGVRADNHAAADCYRAAGFVPFGVEPLATFVGGRFYDETLMVLRLR